MTGEQLCLMVVNFRWNIFDEDRELYSMTYSVKSLAQNAK